MDPLDKSNRQPEHPDDYDGFLDEFFDEPREPQQGPGLSPEELEKLNQGVSRKLTTMMIIAGVLIAINMVVFLIVMLVRYLGWAATRAGACAA